MSKDLELFVYELQTHELLFFVLQATTHMDVFLQATKVKNMILTFFANNFKTYEFNCLRATKS